MLPFIGLLVVAFLVAWLASEFQQVRSLRIVLGLCAITLSYLVAMGVGSLDRFNSNSWYGAASKELIECTITELNNGNTDQVLDELKVLNQQLHPTYETRAGYDELVKSYVSAMSKSRVSDDRRELAPAIEAADK